MFTTLYVGKPMSSNAASLWLAMLLLRQLVWSYTVTMCWNDLLSWRLSYNELYKMGRVVLKGTFGNMRTVFEIYNMVLITHQRTMKRSGQTVQNDIRATYMSVFVPRLSFASKIYQAKRICERPGMLCMFYTLLVNNKCNTSKVLLEISASVNATVCSIVCVLWIDNTTVRYVPLYVFYK